MKGFFFTLLVASLIISGCNKTSRKRTEINLNGIWEIAKTDTLSGMPSAYTSKVPVPGLVDLANPALEDLDMAIKKAGEIAGKGRPKGNISIAFNNAVYWYKRNFTLETGNSDIVQLKINKSMYHTWVYVNGKLAGENVYCFTPSLISIKPFLNESGKENELVIAVGSRNIMPDTVIIGVDSEKVLFVPGIYDDVKLILTGSPNIINVQTAPEIKDEKLSVVAEIGTKPGNIILKMR